MIELEGVTARLAPLALAPVRATLGPGVTALLGAAEDGVSLLLAVLAGRERPRGGALRVLGGTLAASRRAIGYVPLDATLPAGMRVEDVLDLGARVRGEKAEPATTRLETLGIAALATRRVDSLAQEEVRAVALAEALTSTATRVILVEEPFLKMDPRASAEVARRLRARAAAGACVVIGTASPREARSLASQVLLFERGTLVRQGSHVDAVAMHGSRGTALRITSPMARELGAALARERDVRRVTTGDDTLLARGDDARSLAEAVARAAKATGALVSAMQIEPLALDEIRAAHAGDLAGAYQAAADRAKRNAEATAPAAPPPAVGSAT